MAARGREGRDSGEGKKREYMLFWIMGNAELGFIFMGEEGNKREDEEGFRERAIDRSHNIEGTKRGNEISGWVIST